MAARCLTVPLHGRVPAPGKQSERALLAARHPAFLAEFRAGVKRARDASFGDGQGARTHTAVLHWVRLLQGSLGFSPFRPIDPVAPLREKLSEMEVADLYAWWLVAHQRVNHETAKGYVGIVNKWHERETGIALAGGISLRRTYDMLDGYARDVGVPPARLERLGVRPRDLRVGIDAVFDPADPLHFNRASLLETATVGVLRGGDGISRGPKRTFDPAWATTRADVTFFPPHAPRMVRVMAINCKARGVEARRKLPRYLPMTGRYLSPGDMIWHLVTVADPVPESAAATTPLFRDPLTNGMISTSQMREDVRSVMTAAGRDGSKYGAHSCRIGGGTAMDFEHAPPETIKAAGAWNSEAYLAYVRACGQDVLSAAQAICSSDVDDLATDFIDIDADLDEGDLM